jgi:hypothetical protein
MRALFRAATSAPTVSNAAPSLGAATGGRPSGHWQLLLSQICVCEQCCCNDKAPSNQDCTQERERKPHAGSCRPSYRVDRWDDDGLHQQPRVVALLVATPLTALKDDTDSARGDETTGMQLIHRDCHSGAIATTTRDENISCGRSHDRSCTCVAAV